MLIASTAASTSEAEALPVAPAVLSEPVVEPAPAIEAVAPASIEAPPAMPITADPISLPPAVTTPKVDLGEALQASGLVLVETSADKQRSVVQEVQPAPVQPRRRRPAAVIVSDEPMQMVETRK